jgi:hypothetical protein
MCKPKDKNKWPYAVVWNYNAKYLCRNISVSKLEQRLENETIILCPTLRVGISFALVPANIKLYMSLSKFKQKERNPINRLVCVVILLVYVERGNIKIKEQAHKPQNVGTSVRSSVPKCCSTCNSKGALDRVNKQYRIVDHHMKLVHGLVFFEKFCSWLSKNLQFSMLTVTCRY